MIIPMLCVTIFVILVVWFLLPRVARLMIHTPTAISIFVCLSMVQLMAVFISMRCTLCGHFLQVALTLILVVGYAIAASEIACKIRGLMVTVCPSQFATRRTLFHVLVGCGLLMLKVSRLKLPVIWLLVSMWLNTLTKSQKIGRAVQQECRDRYLHSFPTRRSSDLRSGWLWPVDAKGEPLKATSYMAVGFYVAKYVNKKSDMDLAAKGLGAKEWNNSLKTKLSLLPKKLFRIRMSRNFGMKMLTMTNLSTECLIQLTKLGYDTTPSNQILKQNAKREMRLRLGKVTVADVLAAQPVTTNLLKFMRASIKMIGVSNLQSFIASMTQKLTLSDISDESKNYLDKAGITTACLRIKSKWTAGGK